MKKTAAILLLFIFLFNWFGYRLLTYYLEEKANTRLELQLDSGNYNSSELISIKIPANLPYYSNSKEYDRMNGEIEIDGKHYNYVKRRLYNDSLEFLCIPNKEKMKLSNARNEIFKIVNDIQQPGQNKKSGDQSLAGKNLLSEYIQHSNSFSFSAYCQPRIMYSSVYILSLAKPILSPKEQPPDVS